MHHASCIMNHASCMNVGRWLWDSEPHCRTIFLLAGLSFCHTASLNVGQCNLGSMVTVHYRKCKSDANLTILSDDKCLISNISGRHLIFQFSGRLDAVWWVVCLWSCVPVWCISTLHWSDWLQPYSQAWYTRYGYMWVKPGILGMVTCE